LFAATKTYLSIHHNDFVVLYEALVAHVDFLQCGGMFSRNELYAHVSIQIGVNKCLAPVFGKAMLGFQLRMGVDAF
jgi:hypothetical protein